MPTTCRYFFNAQDFNRQAAKNAKQIYAFGIASQQHNEDIRQILGKILETPAQMK
jgi:hypothetical protein